MKASRTSTQSLPSLAVVAAMLLSPLSATAAEAGRAEKREPAIELGAPFADNAILQRQMKVPVWGWSEPSTAPSGGAPCLRSGQRCWLWRMALCASDPLSWAA